MYSTSSASEAERSLHQDIAIECRKAGKSAGRQPLTTVIVMNMGVIKMAKLSKDAMMNRGAVDNLNIGQNIQATASETAEYLAQMASELVGLAQSAKLERLTVLLDLVRQEAESAAA
jgi:hypothetical protein